MKYCKFEEIIILCGRFEGVDTRAIEVLGFEEVSIGDVILIKYGTGIGSNSTTAKIRPGSQFSGVRII